MSKCENILDYAAHASVYFSVCASLKPAWWWHSGCTLIKNGIRWGGILQGTSFSHLEMGTRVINKGMSLDRY